MVHDLREGIGTFFLAIAVAFLSYGCLSAETLLNSLTAKSVLAGTKNSRPVGFYGRNSTFFLVSTTHKQHHHGELPPPPAAQILQLDPIRRTPDAEERLGEGSVEAIQLNR